MKRWGTVLIVVSASLLVLAGGAFALALTAGPLIFTRVVDADERVGIAAAGRSASVEIGAGWAVRAVPWDAGRVTLISPDGVMELSLRFAAGRDGDDLAGVGEGALVPVSREAFEGGELVHARTVDGRSVVGTLTEDGDTIVFVSTAPSDYDAQLAHLLATVEVGR